MQTTKDSQLLPDRRETLNRWLRRPTTPSGQTRRVVDVTPHLLKTFKLSRDPRFAEEVIDVVRL